MTTSSSTSGLTTAAARARLAQDGPNQLVPEPRARRVLQRARSLADPMVVLLLVAAPIYLAIGDRADAIIVAAAIVPIAAVGWLLEARAERTLQSLRELTAPTATIERDGQRVDIPAEGVVVGDLGWLHEGDVVPADGVLAELTELNVDESALTGESLPVAKAPGDAILAGTTVLSGRASFVVNATGARTRYGAIGGLLATARTPRTPLQRSVSRLVRGLALVAAVACTAVVAIERVHGTPWGEAVIAGVSLAIAAVPEEFPMVYTLYLALGAWRLARDRALVRRVPSVETLGATTVICADKTGTLTYGRVAVSSVVGDDPRALIEAAVLASEPAPFDPLDRAIVEYARKAGVDVDRLHANSLVRDYPFDPAGKYVTHVWHERDGSYRIAAKGSAESLAPDGHTAASERLAATGLRVIAVSAGTLAGSPTGDRAADEAALCPLGIIAFEDPVRAGVDDALAQCRTAGVRVIMITGDHPATAHAVVEGLGLPHGDAKGEDLIVTGDEIDAADDAQLDEIVGHANVFARTQPEQKHRLVRALRRRGEVVAMTGDGINDAPALREADIGIAMGERGTAVARDAATMVLLDDNFATIVGAVRDGRRIFDSLHRAFVYLIAFHPPLILAALVVPLVDRPLLLLPVHLILLELLLHPIISLVFETDPPDPDLMTRPPRDPRRGLLGRDALRPLALGTTLAAAVLASYVVALHSWPVSEARAFAFVVLLTGQLVLLLVARGVRRPVTRVLAGVIAVYVAVVIGVVLVHPLAAMLKLHAFPAAGWLLALSIAGASTLWSHVLPERPRS